MRVTTNGDGSSGGELVVLGVDVGATKILVGTVDRAGGIHRSRRYPMDSSGQPTVLASIRQAVSAFLTELAEARPIAAGVGLVGQTDPAAGVWLHSLNLKIVQPVPLADELAALTGLPVCLDNDVHAATLAELQLGAGRGAADFVYLNVGTGISAGLVCGAALVRGAANYAGELGHLAVEPDGEPCVCGQRGCLEPIASGGGILDQVRRRLADHPASVLAEGARLGTLTAGDVFAAAQAGDPLAATVAERAVRALGTALVGLVNLLNPEAIVLGGGVVASDWLVEQLRDRVYAKALQNAARALRSVERSRLSIDQVGLLGAACLAWTRYDSVTGAGASQDPPCIMSS